MSTHAHPTPATLDRRVILITGATGGLGQAIASACAQAGASVVVASRRPHKLGRLVDRISAAGGDISAIAIDMEGASPDDYLQLAQSLQQEYGRLDGIVHCAARFAGLTPLEHTDPAELARALHINLTARIWLVQACLPLLRQTPGATVVFVQDDVRTMQQAYWGGYGLAQQAQAALVPMLAAEQGSGGVRICSYQPGPLRTALRARAFVEEDDRIARAPELAAAECVRLLAGD